MAGKNVKVVILGDAKSAAEAFNQVSESAGKSESKLASIGAKMSSVGATMTKSVTLPLLAVGAGALMAAQQYDDAADTIRAGTGATGEALEGLTGSFQKVFTTVPASVDDASKAIADLNTRTGLTGTALENMAAQVLNLSRLTGEDLGGIIASTTRVFGDWSIATEDQGEALDYLWKVSQGTGIGVTQLSDKVVQFGAPLRQLGFDFETSAAMMGKWEKEGVNIELALGGMKIALGKFAKAGEDPVKALQSISDQIANAGTQAEANKLAIEVFGQRAGPDMAAAIREGRFDLDELLKTLGTSEETIGKAAEDTLSLNEKLTLLKNKAMDAAVPLGEALLAAVEKLWPTIENLIEKVSGAVQWFGDLPTPVQDAAIAMGAVLAVAGPLLSALGPLVSVASNLIGSITGLGTAASGAAGSVGLLSGGLVILAAAVAGVVLVKLISDLAEGQRAADSFHESVKANIETLPGLTEQQENLAIASLQTAETQVKLREDMLDTIMTSEDEKAIAAELAEAWVLSGAKTREEMDAVADKVVESYGRMKSTTAETLYGDDGIVVTNQRAWEQVVIDTSGALTSLDVLTEEKFSSMARTAESQCAAVEASVSGAMAKAESNTAAAMRNAYAAVNVQMCNMAVVAAIKTAAIVRSYEWMYQRIVGGSIVPDLVHEVMAYWRTMSDGMVTMTTVMQEGVLGRFDLVRTVVSDTLQRMRVANVNTEGFSGYGFNAYGNSDLSPAAQGVFAEWLKADNLAKYGNEEGRYSLEQIAEWQAARGMEQATTFGGKDIWRESRAETEARLAREAARTVTINVTGVGQMDTVRAIAGALATV
ncbi:MAG: phage tail tape measure protein [Methanothrix sp.]|nr:phage tail tape measure protein [Methanothrix sp.]